MENTARGEPRSSTHHPKDQIPSNVPTLMGFPISMNQFNVLSKSEFAESQSQVQEEASLINPRSTRLQRLLAVKRAEDKGILLNEGTFESIVPPDFVEPTFFDNSLSVSTTENSVKNSVGNFELETGDLRDAMYNSDVKEVICTENLNWNKRVSNAEQEWSVGRPGNRPVGTRDAAQNSDTCLGPYATCDCIQSSLMGHNTREEIQASSRRTQGEDQDITNQPTASSSRRFAVEDRASPVIAVLHPCRPPYFPEDLTMMSTCGCQSLIAG